MITEVDGRAAAEARLTARVDLLGEIQSTSTGSPSSSAASPDIPLSATACGCWAPTACAPSTTRPAPARSTSGTLQQDSSIGAYINVDEMLRKHFAFFGTTGVGKSSGVAVILRADPGRASPNLRVFLIDPHNEYGHCFGERAQVLNPKNLKLPFWLFNFEEIVDVFFRGRPGVEEEVEILSEVIPHGQGTVRQRTAAATATTLRKTIPNGTGVHRRHAGALSPLGPDPPDRRAHGQAREPLLHDQVQPADLAHRDGAQGPALRLHVRQRQCRRRHHGGGR